MLPKVNYRLGGIEISWSMLAVWQWEKGANGVLIGAIPLSLRLAAPSLQTLASQITIPISNCGRTI